MRTTSARRLAAALLLTVVVAVTGCTGTPQRRGGPGTTRTPGGTTGTNPGGSSGPGTSGTGAGGPTPASPSGTSSSTGTTPGGTPGTSATARTTHSDLGAQISAVVAGADPRVSPGAAASAVPLGNRPGVSTLVVGNLAYVGIDLSSAPTTLGGSAAHGPGSTAYRPGTTPGTYTGPGPGGTTVGPNPQSGAGSADVIRTRVRSAFPEIADVFVTTDPNLVARLARITGDIQSGISNARRLDEIISVTQTMTRPTATGRVTTTPTRQ